MLALLETPKTAKQVADLTGLHIVGARLKLDELVKRGQAVVVGMFKVPKAPSVRIYRKILVVTSDVRDKMESTFWKDLQAEVLATVEANQHMTRLELIAAIGKSKATLRQAVNNLIRDGKLHMYMVGNTQHFNTGAYPRQASYRFKTVFVDGKNPFI